MLLSEVAKITGAKDTHEKEREREERDTRKGRKTGKEVREYNGREKGARGKKRGGQSEIIIIAEVVFQGQYLRFSSTVSLKHNPPHHPQPHPSVPPLSTAASRQTPIFPSLLLPLQHLFPVTHSAEEGCVPSPWSLPRMSHRYSRQLPYGFSNTGGIKWAINKQTGLLSVYSGEPPVSQRRNKVTGHQTTSPSHYFTGL